MKGTHQLRKSLRGTASFIYMITFPSFVRRWIKSCWFSFLSSANLTPLFRQKQAQRQMYKRYYSPCRIETQWMILENSRHSIPRTLLVLDG